MNLFLLTQLPLTKTRLALLGGLTAWMGLISLASTVRADSPIALPDYSVTWNQPGKNDRDSMPLGNGTLGINLWTESNGDVVFLIGKDDAWSENSQLQKLGRVRLSLSPSPFTAGDAYRQILHPTDGTIELRGASNARLLAWVDIASPVIHVQFDGGSPVTVKAAVELWRTETRRSNSKKGNIETEKGFRETNGNPDGGVTVDPDTVLTDPNAIVWAHRNARSLYPGLLENQHLSSLAERFPDPFINRTYGVLMKGVGVQRTDDRTLQSHAAESSFGINLYALTAQTPDLPAWQSQINSVAAAADRTSAADSLAATMRWWKAFWQRSYVIASGNADAADLTQGYAMQRWMTAASGRGKVALKYNGSIFTVGQEPPAGKPYDPDKGQTDPDYRAWGSNYWFQNQRLIYWPMIANGDWDTLEPFIDMYRNALPLAIERTNLYWHHPGAIFPETMFFFGLPNDNDFGYGNKGVELKQQAIRWHFENGLELIAMMLSRYSTAGDDAFARDTLLPLAEQITLFYDNHWKRVNGKIVLDPSQAIETRHPAVNDCCDIAGLMYVLPRLLDLPQSLTTPAQRELWTKLLHDLPPLPMGKTNAAGKCPDKPADAAADGADILWPATAFGRPQNVENPELYAVYPFELYGLGLPDLPLALNTYRARRSLELTCWSQNAIDAACLGLTEDARRGVMANFHAYGSERFKWSWKDGHDYEPDLDNGGAGQIAVQKMLVQERDGKLLLMPTWPKDWDVSFKLYAADHTVVECRYRRGQIESLEVTPASRARDVVRPTP